MLDHDDQDDHDLLRFIVSNNRPQMVGGCGDYGTVLSAHSLFLDVGQAQAQCTPQIQTLKVLRVRVKAALRSLRSLRSATRPGRLCHLFSSEGPRIVALPVENTHPAVLLTFVTTLARCTPQLPWQ